VSKVSGVLTQHILVVDLFPSKCVPIGTCLCTKTNNTTSRTTTWTNTRVN